MELTEEQKTAVLQWIQDGAGPSDIQKRLKENFQILLTYLETRFLADDLKLKFKDPEPPTEAPPPEPVSPEPLPAPGKVNVTMDQITRPGSIISGRATFPDGETAEWHLDQMGRLGFNPSKPGYRPAQEDIMAFQVELEKLARQQGL